MSGRVPRRMTRAVVTASLLFAALATSVLPDHLLNLVCRSGVVMDVDACCPSEAAGTTPAAGQTAWRDEACCSLRAIDLDRVVPDRPGESVVARTPLAVPERPVSPAPAERPLACRAVAPPPLGPPIPLVLLKSSFLL